jgi:hypothetical protein
MQEYIELPEFMRQVLLTRPLKSNNSRPEKSMDRHLAFSRNMSSNIFVDFYKGTILSVIDEMSGSKITTQRVCP